MKSLIQEETSKVTLKRICMPVFIKAVSSLSVVKVTVIVFFRWDGAFSLKIKTVEQWNRYYTGKLRV